MTANVVCSACLMTGVLLASPAAAQTAPGASAAPLAAPAASAPAATAPAAPASSAPAATVPAVPASTVPDATLRAVKDRRVILATRRGSVAGKLLAFDSDSVTLALDDGNVLTFSRVEVLTVHLAENPAAVSVVPAPASLPPPVDVAASVREEEGPKSKPAARHVGVHIGLPPGVAFDVDYGNFHAFISTSLLFPIASSGQMFAFTAGAGPTFALTDRWHFDLFFHLAPMFWQQYYYSVGNTSGLRFEPFLAAGVGMGFHYTAPSGWCVGITLPLLGGAAGNYPAFNDSVGIAAAYYYLASAMSLPGFSFGYRL